MLSISLLVGIVIGGLGSLVGAILGSALLVFLRPEVTDLGRDAGFTDAQSANIAPLVYGVVLIVVMLVAPRGVVGSIRMAYLNSKAKRQIKAAQASPLSTAVATRTSQSDNAGGAAPTTARHLGRGCTGPVPRSGCGANRRSM